MAPQKRVFTIPNFLTFLRIIGAFVVFWILADAKSDTFLIGIALVLTIVFAITDWLDGYLARNLHQVSKLGTRLDPVADKALVYGVTVTLIFVYHIVPAWFLVVLGIRDCLVIGLAEAVTVADVAGKEFKVTFFAKSKTAIQDIFIIVGIAIVFWWPVSATVLDAWYAAVWFVGMLTLASLVHYFWVNRESLKIFWKERKTS